MDDAVFADERRARMAEFVATRGRARIRELAERFGVTEPTVRKDLSALQDRGVLKRTYGGALALRPIVERAFEGREATNRAGKEAIARACVEQLRDGDAVFLDSGTSVDAIARTLAERNREGEGLRLSILTNTPRIAELLAGVPRVECILLGGRLQGGEGSVVGDLALENLQRFTFGVAFLGVSGFSEAGASVGTLAEAALKAAVIERARRVVVPLEQVKVGATDFARIAGLDEIDAVVMDQTSPAVADMCAAHGIELIAAKR